MLTTSARPCNTGTVSLLADTLSQDTSRLRALIVYWLPVIVCVGAMFTMSSLPNPYALIGNRFTISDLVAHTGGFFVLMLLVSRLVAFRRGETGLPTVLRSAALCIAYAVVDELHQIPIPGRGCEWIDLFANSAGILAGGVVALLAAVAVGKARPRD